MNFTVNFSSGKFGNCRQLALHHDDAALALERLDAEQDRDGAGAGGAVERDVDALAAGDLHDARERVFLLHVDDVIGAELLGDLHAARRPWTVPVTMISEAPACLQITVCDRPCWPGPWISTVEL